MEAFLGQTEQQFLLFLLILARISAVFVFAPVFGSASVPVQVKAGLSLLIAILLTIAYPVDPPEITVGLELILRIGSEVIMGGAVGFVANLMFEAVLMAGELVGVQMGFGIVNVIDPVSSVQISIVGQLKFLLAVLVFLGIGGHRMFLDALAQSFTLLPVGQIGFATEVGQHFVNLFGSMLVLTVKLAAPVLVSLLVASFAEGMIARTVPQINIFIIGFGIRIAFGLFMLMVSIGFFVLVITHRFEQLPQQFDQLFRILAW